MAKAVVRAEGVVEGVLPYSQCIRAGDFLIVAGQLAWDADGNVVGAGDIRAQARQAFENMRALVEAGGATMADVVKLNAFVTDIRNAPAATEVRKEFFDEPYPASTTVAVTALVMPELLFEVEALVHVGPATG